MLKKILLITIVSVLLLIRGSFRNAQKIDAEENILAEHISNEVIIKLKNSDKIYLLKTTYGLHEVIEVNQRNQTIEYIEPNYLYRAAIEPHDPFYTQELHLSSTWANLAWNYTTGSKDYTIAIIDTGVDIDHEDLKNNIWRNVDEIQGNSIDDDGNGFIDDVVGWDFTSENPDPRPKFTNNYSFLGINHGTIVAGIAAAEGNNSIGIVGITWHASIMSLRVLDSSGTGNTFDVARAIDYARENNAHIINLSFVGSGYSATLNKAIEKAHQAGILIIAAAGNEVNEGVNMSDSPQYPVCHDGYNGDNWVIGVASLDNSDKLASFSNYGDCIDVAAPGVGLFSTLYQNENYKKFNRAYGGYWSGTSVSAPQVAGLAVLLKSLKPMLSVFELKDLIISNADNVEHKNFLYQNKLGSGKINILQSVIAARKITPKAELSFDRIITSPDSNGGPHIKIFKADKLETQFFAFEEDKIFGANVATVDISQDEVENIIVSAAKGEKPWVKIFDIYGNQKAKFLAFDENFIGGVKIAAGDVDHDGEDEIVAVPESDYAPIVKIFALTGSLEKEFYAFNKFFTKGLNIAVADINNDKFDEIIITPSHGTSPIIKFFNYAGLIIGQFMANDANFFNGVNIAVGDINGDNQLEIITGNRVGASPEVKIFNVSGVILRRFLAYHENFIGGVNVAAGDINGNGIDDIVTGAGPGGGPHVRIFTADGQVITQFFAYDQKFRGGVAVSVEK